MRVNVLTPGFTTSNGSAFLFPLVVHKTHLRDAAIDVRMVQRSSPQITDCDVLAIDSKEFRNGWGDNKSRTLELISSYSESGATLVWFDTTDSTGTLQADVLPVVDRYLKAQLLSNKSRYTKRIYGGRLHSEYYHDLAGVADDDGISIDQPISVEDTLKLGISWNSGLADYSTYGPWRIGLYRRIKFARLLRYPAPFQSSNSDRPNDLSARFGATYSKATVRYQREQIRDLLASRLDTNKLSRRGYMKELQRSKVVISPFGWGEITLKDFEVFLSGSLLLKPSMDHMRTWPDFYEKNVTVLTHDWDLANLEEQIELAVNNEGDRIEIAAQGQQRYAEYTSGPNAAEKFVTHFREVMSL
jgi:hypothetical protein